jgi:hypothetical protein
MEEYRMQATTNNQAELIVTLNNVRRELEARGRVDNFYDSLAASYLRYGSLTERQEAALRRSLESYQQRAQQRAARPAPTQAMPEGRVTVTGTVRTLKWVENDFGGSLKMLLESDFGWRVWGTVPSSLAYAEGGDLEVGDRVQFDAAVTRKEADFGFYSRPTKACIVARKPQEVEPVVQQFAQQQQEAQDVPAERPVSFAPIAKDIMPEDLVKGAPAPVRLTLEQAVAVTSRREPAPVAPVSPLGLAAMVAAAGYKE